MFDSLTNRLAAVFGSLGTKVNLTERDVDAALKSIRMALLEADVHFTVVRDFVGRVRDRAIGTEILRGLKGQQQVVKIVHEELTASLTGSDHRLLTNNNSNDLTVAVLVGLQGSGKTTTAAKLAAYVRERIHQNPILVAADIKRPAAIDQLLVLGEELGIPVYYDRAARTVAEVVSNSLVEARKSGFSYVIIDTGGRLHVDEELMEELSDLIRITKPQEKLMVVDSMTGQDAIRHVTEFHSRLELTGLVLTKVDGDARGGAALSATAMTGVPIKLMGVGEKNDAIEEYRPDRLASRILGMGDVLTLVEKAQRIVTDDEVRALEQKIRKEQFDLQDFLDQLNTVRRMGPLSQVMEMIPGFAGLKNRVDSSDSGDALMNKMEAIIQSMTLKERTSPGILNGSRRKRIAFGSGTTVQEVNQLLGRFNQMEKMIRQINTRKGSGLDIGRLLKG